jgi:hypothetical protein
VENKSVDNTADNTVEKQVSRRHSFPTDTMVDVSAWSGPLSLAFFYPYLPSNRGRKDS